MPASKKLDAHATGRKPPAEMRTSTLVDWESAEIAGKFGHCAGHHFLLRLPGCDARTKKFRKLSLEAIGRASEPGFGDKFARRAAPRGPNF